VKSWLKIKFARRPGKKSEKEKEVVSEKTFVGGAALTGATASNNDSTPSLGVNSTSMRNVALATSAGKLKKERRPRKSGDSDVSSLSTGVLEEDDEFQEARDNFDETLAPPPTFSVEKSSSPVRAAKFKEEI